MGNCFRLPRPKPESRPNQAPQYLAIEPEPDGLEIPKGPEVHPETEPEFEEWVSEEFGEWVFEKCRVAPEAECPKGGGTDLRLEKFKIKSVNFDFGGQRGVDGGGSGKK